MFGYILPEKPEMKIREYELFRAYYCGVCKSIGKRHGHLKRLSITYDSAFLSILLSSLAGEKAEISRERCIIHPLDKRNTVGNSSTIDYISDMNVLMLYYKLADNWKDEASVVSGGAMLLMKKKYAKLRKKYAEKCAIIEKRLGELALLEKEGCRSMDQAAEPFARLMEELIAWQPGKCDGEVLEPLRWLGYNVGKWIYILDAYHDMEEDVKNNSFNVLIRQFGFNSKGVNEDMDGFKERIKKRIEFNLIHSLSQIDKAYKLLNIGDNSEIIENIIYMGMLRKTEAILGIGRCSVIEKSI